jgi:sigma-70-like protein
MGTGTRLVDAPPAVNHAPRQEPRAPANGEPNPIVLHAAITSWRAWLTSGVRRVPIDHRRARGADPHVKQVLSGGPSGAVDFPSAMARQAIDEAMNELPTQHRQVVKLAYFGGITNRQIAQQLGLTVGGVRGRLRESLANLSRHLERGRTNGRGAIHGLVMWFSMRRFGDGTQSVHRSGFDHVVQAMSVAVVTLTAAAVIGTHGVPPGHSAQPLTAPRISSVAVHGYTAPRADDKGGPPSGSVPVAAAPRPATFLPAVPVGLPAVVKVPVALPVNLPAPAALPTPASDLLHELGA